MHHAVKMLILSLCMMAGSSRATNDYRLFIDRSGRTIEAKVLNLDLKTNGVELELRTGKKGLIPLSELELTDEDKLFFNELKACSVFADPNKLVVKISENISPHYDPGIQKTGKKHAYTLSLTNLSDLDFRNVYVEYCIYRDLGNNKNRSTNLELPVQDLLAGKTVTVKSTQTHATFKSAGKMTISGLRVRLLYKRPDGSYAIREQCYPRTLPEKNFAWARSKREMEEERSNAAAPTSYPPVKMTEKDVRKLAETYIKTWKPVDYKTWKKLLYPMHVGRQELEPGWFERTAKRVKSLEILTIDGRNVKMRVSYHSKFMSDKEGWLRITPSGHIKYTPVIFKTSF